MKKIIGFVAVVIMLTAALVFNFTQSRTPVVTDGNLPRIHPEVLDSFSEYKASEIEKIIRENERIRFEQYGGSTKKQIEDTLDGLI